jgi:hypothetical protein
MAQDNDFLAAVPIQMGEMEPAGAPGDLVSQGATLVQSKTEYHTAVQVQKPRELSKIRSMVLQEAEYAAGDFYYSWEVKDKNSPTGKKLVEGISIGGTMSLLREWGNCVLDIKVEDLGTHLVFTPAFVDLERGTTITRAYKFRPTSAPGRFDSQRWADMQFQLAQSKAIRNVVKAAMPSWLVNEIVRRAKIAEIKQIDDSGVEESKTKAIEFYSKIGVSLERLEASIGEPYSEWTAENIALLRSYGRQYREGDLNVEQVFPPVDAPAPENNAKQDAPEPGQSEDTPAPEPQESEESKPAKEAPALASGKDNNDLLEMISKKKLGDKYQMDPSFILGALAKMDGGDLTAKTFKAAMTALVKTPPAMALFDKALGTDKAAK